MLARGLALAETIGARRFQSIILAGLADVRARGRARRARRASGSSARSRWRGKPGWAFAGRWCSASRPGCLDDTREREQCRAEAEALLAQGCASHNTIDYHRQGIEDALARGEWARGLEHAAALDAYTRAEPLPYSDFLIARARVLVGLASRPADQGLHDELARLRADAERVRWPIAWPAWAPSDDAPPAGAS